MLAKNLIKKKFDKKQKYGKKQNFDEKNNFDTKRILTKKFEENLRKI